ncbi:MAG: RNA polymerase sigma factor [Isosphaeraceae bacterium]
MISPERLATLFDAHAPALLLYARQWCDRDSAEDLVQQAFLSLARQTVVPDEVLAWLYRVVRNAAVSRIRFQVRRLRRESAASVPEAWFDRADDRIDAEQATRMLEGLPAENREAIAARIWGGLTFDQIGRLQGCSPATAFRRYRDGLATLQERMGRPCPTSSTT